MVEFLKRMLPLLAAFLLGSVLVVFASAEPEKCDWSRSSDTFLTYVGSGASTPQEALKSLQVNANIRVPDAAVTETTGDDRFTESAIDRETGSVSYAIYIDGVHRIQATADRLADGTYVVNGFSTCYGV